MNGTNSPLKSTDVPSNINAQLGPTKKTRTAISHALGLCVGVLFLIIFLAYTSCLCHRKLKLSSLPTSAAGNESISAAAVEQELGANTHLNYPKILYSQAKLTITGDSAAATGRSICLSEYKDTDTLRLLPECTHIFHLRCTDPG